MRNKNTQSYYLILKRLCASGKSVNVFNIMHKKNWGKRIKYFIKGTLPLIPLKSIKNVVFNLVLHTVSLKSFFYNSINDFQT